MPVIEVERSGIASGQGMVTCGWGGSGVAVGCSVAVEAGVGVGRGVAVGIGVAAGTGVGRRVGSGVAVGCGVEVADGVAVGVGLGVAVGASVGVGRGVAVGASVEVRRGVAVGAGVSVAEGVGGVADAVFASVVRRTPAAVVASMLAVGVGVGAWVGGIVAAGSVASDAHAKTANSRATHAKVARSLFSMGGIVARSNRRNDYRVLESSDGLDEPLGRGLPVLSWWIPCTRRSAAPCLC